jgi:formate dehydrogenase family accessory protein FdhD
MLVDMPELERVKISRVSKSGKELCYDVVVSEVEVVVKLNGKVYRTLHCLPTYLEELARGHLVSEGICHYPDIKGIEVEYSGNKFVVAVTFDRFNPTKLEKTNSQSKITTAEIWDAIEKMDENGVLFKKTGGTHVVGIYDRREYIFVEDASRHCAIDKAIGLAFARGIDLTSSILVTSCRQTKSTLRKTIHSQIPIVITNSAPSSLAVKDAQEFGITLIGFARERRFNIYSHGQRVVTKESKW